MKGAELPRLILVQVPTLLATFWRRLVKRPAAPRPAGKNPPSYIVFRLDALGDVVLTTPLFSAIKSANPKARCCVVVQSAYKSLLATNPHVDEVLGLPRVPAWLPTTIQRLLAALGFYWRHLRSRQFDFVIVPRWDVDEHFATLLCVLATATCRVGYSSSTSAAKERWNRGFDKAFDVCLEPGPVRHEVLRNLAIAEALGLSHGAAKLDICVTEHDRRRATRILSAVSEDLRLIALGIGAASPGRRWPLQLYAETINRLGASQRIQPLILCASAEGDEAAQLAALLQRPPMVLAGAPLRDVAAVLERCDLFLGNDSGCAHLAAAMGCKTIVISRHPKDGDPNHYNSPVRFAPQGVHVRVLQPDRGKGGCTQACTAPEPHCITQVSAGDVVLAAEQMLALKAPRNNPHAGLKAPSRELLQAHSTEAIRRVMLALNKEGEPPVQRGQA